MRLFQAAFQYAMFCERGLYRCQNAASCRRTHAVFVVIVGGGFGDFALYRRAATYFLKK